MTAWTVSDQNIEIQFNGESRQPRIHGYKWTLISGLFLSYDTGGNTLRLIHLVYMNKYIHIQKICTNSNLSAYRQ